MKTKKYINERPKNGNGLYHGYFEVNHDDRIYLRGNFINGDKIGYWERRIQKSFDDIAPPKFVNTYYLI